MKHAFVLLLASVLVVAVCGWRLQGGLYENAEEHWDAFVSKYQKVYAADEAEVRFRIFRNNLKRIDNLNRKHTSAHFAINKFADLSAEEMAGRFKMPNFRPRYSDADYAPLSAVDNIPDSYDWRDKGAITAVKDQGQCGSCWAFSATEEIESQWILKGHAAAILAPQQIVDCDQTDGGCDGGDTPTAYQYVIKAGGMETEADYPYKAKDQTCAFNAAKIAVKITGWQYVVKKKNETEMLNALASAPLSICVDASTWDFYDSGVISKNCGHELDHCVQAVAYGTDAATGLQYWNVRNSWGTDWGEKGYIRIQRDQGNLCGIASEVTVAII